MWKFQNTDEFYHHGILGMKWGIRRYQYADGSLTPEGRKRKQRDSNGNLTKYGAKQLSKQLNKNTNERHVPIKYNHNNTKAYTVYQLNNNDKERLKAKTLVNSLLLGPIGGALVTNYKFKKDKGKELTEYFMNNSDRTIIIGDEKSLIRYSNRK